MNVESIKGKTQVIERKDQPRLVVYDQIQKKPKQSPKKPLIPKPKISPTPYKEVKLKETPQATKPKTKIEEINDMLVSLQTIPVDDDFDD